MCVCCVCVVAHVCATHLQSCVINDFGGWVNTGGQPHLVILSWLSVNGPLWTQSLRWSQPLSHLYISFRIGGRYTLSERREEAFFIQGCLLSPHEKIRSPTHTFVDSWKTIFLKTFINPLLLTTVVVLCFILPGETQWEQKSHIQDCPGRELLSRVSIGADGGG